RALRAICKVSPAQSPAVRLRDACAPASMEVFVVSSVAVRNRLLASLPPDSLSRLLPKMRACPLTAGETLIRPNTRIQSVWFVECGWVSVMVTALDDGGQAEVGLVGR